LSELWSGLSVVVSTAPGRPTPRARARRQAARQDRLPQWCGALVGNLDGAQTLRFVFLDNGTTGYPSPPPRRSGANATVLHHYPDAPRPTSSCRHRCMTIGHDHWQERRRSPLGSHLCEIPCIALSDRRPSPLRFEEH
jgi:hypothetical protein